MKKRKKKAGKEEKAYASGLSKISQQERICAAKKLSKMLEKEIQETTFSPDILPVVKALHSTFLYRLLRQESVFPAAQILSCKKYVMEFHILHLPPCSRWIRHVARASWILVLEKKEKLFAKTYPSILEAYAREELAKLKGKGLSVKAAELLSIPAAQKAFPMKMDLYQCYVSYFVPDSISKDLSKLLELNPKDEYPAARCMKRRFVIHVGGTNTGKTYQSLQRLKEASSGVYLAPLRLLALEVQENLLSDGISCSLRTGEEEDIRSDATHISSTVEKLNISKLYQVAVIDECQMIADPQRGFAWTRAILGVQASEIHLCTAPEGLDVLERLLSDLGDPYQTIFHERKVPLIWQEQRICLQEAKAGDALIAFSKRDVLQIADVLQKEGLLASVIYGNLPYSTRRQQMQRFLSGETKIVVATDAIGMGLNLPIHRIVFTADEKFDGTKKRTLYPSEIRQIAGRAGRFGIYNEGFVTATPMCWKLDIASCLSILPQPIPYAFLGFSDLIQKVNHPLIEVLQTWNQMPVKSPYRRMDISRYIFLIGTLQSNLHAHLSKAELLKASNIPFQENNSVLMAQFLQYMDAYTLGTERLKRPIAPGEDLEILELYYKQLDLYYSFSNTFHLHWDKDWLKQEKEKIADKINHLLVYDLGDIVRKDFLKRELFF